MILKTYTPAVHIGTDPNFIKVLGDFGAQVMIDFRQFGVQHFCSWTRKHQYACCRNSRKEN